LPEKKLRFAKVHQDTYQCHNFTLIEFSKHGPENKLSFEVSPELASIPTSRILCSVCGYCIPGCNTFNFFKVDLIEEKGSGSLLFTLPKTQLSKCQRALKLFGSVTSSSSKPIPDFDETKLKLPKRTELRHAREWVQLNQLTEQQSVHVVHYRQLVRYKIYNLLCKRPYSLTSWRRRITLDWDEKIFRAVFAPLGEPTRPTIIRHPRELAPTLDGAWATKTARMLQILARPGKPLQVFLALEEFQRSQNIFLAKQIDV